MLSLASRLVARTSAGVFNSTTDVEVRLIPDLDRMLSPLLRTRVFPALAELFGLEPAWLLLRELFLVRYSSDEQCSLPPHVDQSYFSFVIQLSDPAEVCGGGTAFEHLSHPVSAPPGGSLLFAGGVCPHAGAAVTKGERIVITGFVDVCAPKDVAEKKGGFLTTYGGRARPDTFAAPHLRCNVDMLCEAYGASRTQLLTCIAQQPSPAPFIDMEPLQRQCRCVLLALELTLDDSSPKAHVRRMCVIYICN